MTITIDQQIACVRRELAMRQRNYPRWVADGRMKQAEMDHQLAAMQAVHDTLMVWHLVDALRSPEGGSVELCCDNPDFNGLPNCMVAICDEFTNWESKSYRGDTLLLCLQTAKSERDEKEKMKGRLL